MVGKIDIKDYLKTLFFFDLAGLTMAVFVFVFLRFGADAQGLSINFWAGLYVLVIIGRLLFHRRIGAFRSQETIFRIGSVLIPLVSFLICLGLDFQPFFGVDSSLRPVLGAVGVLIGYILNWVLICFGLILPLAVSGPRLRGYERK